MKHGDIQLTSLINCTLVSDGQFGQDQEVLNNLGIAKEGVMRIRDLQWKGLPMWPPEWWVSDEGAGEAGILKKALFRNDQTPPCISVVATHLDQDMNGIILLENPNHLESLCRILKENIGRPLQEIGDLTIDFLPIPKMGQKKVRRPPSPRSAAFLPAGVIELKLAK